MPNVSDMLLYMKLVADINAFHICSWLRWKKNKLLVSGVQPRGSQLQLLEVDLNKKSQFEFITV